MESLKKKRTDSSFYVVHKLGANVASLILKEGQLTPGPHLLTVRRFCAEYPNNKNAANLGRPIHILQSTYYNRVLSMNVTTSLQHLGTVDSTRKSAAPAGHPGAPSRQSPAGKDQMSSDDISDELAVNEYGSCDKFDFRKETYFRNCRIV
jgi:hypothetical protein